MNKSYLYQLGGGCGSTKLELVINNDSFTSNMRILLDG